MPYRPVESALNASTIDILNVIRDNGTLEYQNTIPPVQYLADIPAVGEALLGHPALANQFINSLINRIALVLARSMFFNNPYKDLKKGFLNYGEVVEDIFIAIAKPFVFTDNENAATEFMTYNPDVKSAFHVQNWAVYYPVSVKRERLNKAFLTEDGVTELITEIINSVYKAAEYDEFLLFKYLLIKGVNNGDIFVNNYSTLNSNANNSTATQLKNAASIFRGLSNKLLFPSDQYNYSHVFNNTPRDKQVIFMGAEYNAKFDVEVLASAFNMEKADFMGRLYLIDDFTTFDNNRFSKIVEESNMLSPVTDAELNAMTSVNCLIGDSDFFQIYDNLFQFEESHLASGLKWNYFLHSWKTISTSPFSNMIAVCGTA